MLPYILLNGDNFFKAYNLLSDLGIIKKFL